MAMSYEEALARRRARHRERMATDPVYREKKLAEGRRYREEHREERRAWNRRYYHEVAKPRNIRKALLAEGVKI